MPDADSITRAALALGAATLGEAGARRMHRRIKPAWPGARVAAPAFPVRCSPGDNPCIHAPGVGPTWRTGWGELTTGVPSISKYLGCVRDCGAMAFCLPAHKTKRGRSADGAGSRPGD
jgi:hypothetical protein